MKTIKIQILQDGYETIGGTSKFFAWFDDETVYISIGSATNVRVIFQAIEAWAALNWQEEPVYEILIKDSRP